MKRWIIAALAVACSAHAAQLPAAKAAGIERLVREFMARHNVPGLSVAVVADGELQWSAAYGLADVENNVAVKATTEFRSASIGKTMTAAAAMQLADAGKLDLDADIRRYCPAFPAKQ